MRNISPAALARVTAQYATEPITIVEIDWVEGTTFSYADRTVQGIPGRILSLGALDSVLDITRSNTTQALDLVLDDTSGVIKRIIDTQDIHQIDVRVFQYFNGLPLADKFLIFSGKLNTPFTWSEGSRSFTFDIVSEIENREFGFSPEEGDIPGLPSDLVGRPWPSIFGTVQNVPAVQILPAVTGSTLCGVGILAGKEAHLNAPLGATDCALGTSLALAGAQISHLNRMRAAWASDSYLPGANNRANGFLTQANNIRAQAAEAVSNRAIQEMCARRSRIAQLEEAESQGEGCNPLRVVGGEDFPQDTVIKINVDGIILTGTMSGQNFTITNREHAPTEEAAEVAEERVSGISFGFDPCSDNPPAPAQPFEFEGAAPPRRGIAILDDNNNATGDFTTITETIRSRGFVFCTLTQTLTNNLNDSVLQSQYAEAGARVTIAEGETITYVASITPGTVLDVKARKQFEGETRLVSVPQSYYNVTTQDFGTFTATLITMDQTLSSRVDEGWSEDIFVTFAGSIGPNTVDIVKFIIDEYTDLSYDASSFAAVRARLDQFPSEFAILDRRNTIDLIKDIAFQARCATWVSDGKFFLKYLPEEPVSDKTITLDDIELNSVTVTSSRTEDIVTKLTVRYTPDYAEDPETIILRNNVDRYGTREREVDWFIYSNASTAYHAASFWMIRMSNTWKRMSFTGFLNLLELETFDTITLDVPDYVADTAIKSVVDVADYDSASNAINFTVEVPVKLGFQIQHPFYWPADSTLTYPSVFDTDVAGEGLAALASGTLPGVGLDDTPFQDIPAQTVRIGGPNGVFGARSSNGTLRPGDVGFRPGPQVIRNSFVDVDNTPAPVLDLAIEFLEPAEGISPVQQPLGAQVIDIRTTAIADSENRRVGVLADFIQEVDDDGRLVLRTDSLWTDGTDKGEFDFKYDTEDEQWGAGTAFLED